MAEAIDAVALGAVLDEARTCLRRAGIDDAAAEARLLVGSAASLSAIELVAGSDLPVPMRTVLKIRSMVERRAGGEPVHRILGWREFYGLRLSLSAATLEPRPDTETLVDLVLPEARRAIERDGECAILDLGTGSGAIALALLDQVPQATAIGVDISVDALETAGANAGHNGLGGRFLTLQSDWFENVTGRYHIIVANPPYIATKVIATLDRGVRDHDPPIALDGGMDGLDAYRRIAARAGGFLCPGGVVAVETGHDQQQAVAEVFGLHGFSEIASARDLGGRDRAMMFAG